MQSPFTDDDAVKSDEGFDVVGSIVSTVMMPLKPGILRTL